MRRSKGEAYWGHQQASEFALFQAKAQSNHALHHTSNFFKYMLLHLQNVHPNTIFTNPRITAQVKIFFSFTV